MESNPLRQFLQSLCCNSFWNYAVFWKLQHQTQMLLTLEDVYCHTPKQRESTESLLNNMGEDLIELAVTYMSSVQYSLGDGVVDEVACSGNYRWVFSDDISAGEDSSKLVTKYPDEWIFQFAAGIKTLLLVPVVPHGVLQLGSMETVAEDLALVAYVKDKFTAYQYFVGCSVPFSDNRLFPAHSASSLMSITNQITSPNMGENLTKIFGKDVLNIPNGTTENDISVQLMGLMEGPEPLCQSFNCNKLEMMENSLFSFSCIEEELQAFSQANSDNMGVFGEYAIETMMSDSDRGMTAQTIVYKEAGNVGTLFSFPRDCELHKALGPTIMEQTNKYLRDSPISGEDVCNSSSLICNGDYNNGTGPTGCETCEPFVKGDDAEHLLGSVFADVDCSLDNSLSDRTINVKSSTTSLEQFSAFPEEQSQSERRTLMVEDAVLQSCVTSAFVDRVRNAKTSSSLPASSFESVMSALIGEEQQKKGYHYTHPRKGSKLSSDGKRRTRTGDNQKPRPRDRQLIQDHLKELRELVPNGVKCSIDGLLDRTIQHMLFLRSVTDQADRLRQLVHQEVAGGKNSKSANKKCGQLNGTSWAFELGSEQQICPIIVEDLEYPGHMLIEMLCNDHGRFLKIAEVIRRLELTILKGVMENRPESSWAQFIVEVPRGFHRLDIFWPLMQLLQ